MKLWNAFYKRGRHTLTVIVLLWGEKPGEGYRPICHIEAMNREEALDKAEHQLFDTSIVVGGISPWGEVKLNVL